MPERLCKFLPGAEQQRQMFGAGAAGVGHVDMRIGAVGDECVGVLHHFGRHIGVQVEADHQRQILADHLAHAAQDFAFAVVEMFGHHGAVQVEIDGVERAGRRDAVDHLLGDALKASWVTWARGGGGGRDGRDQLPAIDFRRLDEAGEADIDVAHDLEHAGRAVRHGSGRPRASHRNN